jgi:hypothetical protein
VLLRSIREQAAVPIKVCGLPARFEYQRCQQYLKIPGVSRVGVTLGQAKILQSEEQREILGEKKPVEAGPGKV